MPRIFFATDVHGSEKCWRKFINAGKVYKADILILGGDLTGKAIIPIVKENNRYRVSFLDQVLVVKESDIKNIMELIRDKGLYPYVLSREEYEEYASNPAKVEKLFIELSKQVLKDWVAWADRKLEEYGLVAYVCPGNDDRLEVDSVIDEAKRIIRAESKVLEVFKGIEMISTGWTNPTPWKTPRECSEEELYERIKAMAEKIKDVQSSIFNLHAPPYNSKLDEAPELDEKLRPKYGGRATVPVGSKAVRRAIEEYQPMLGLHGHIHESRGVTRIGRTICLNPGSSYDQGILLGYLIDIENGYVKSLTPTSG